MTNRPKAYSYARISSKRQKDGDGLDRQMSKAREYAAEHDLDLDRELYDVGSGYHGKHVKFGELGGFLKLIEQGKVPVGSWLLVESLDRLSREDVLIAQNQFIELLLAGVTIATLMDGQVYHKDRDDMQLIMSLAYMMRANDESETKSKRAKAKIIKRKTQALEGKKIYNVSLVHWIDQTRMTGDNYQYSLNEHAKTVQRIYELADSGVGTHSIARILNQSNTAVFRPKTNTKNQWRDATVAAILRDEICIGTYKVWQEVDGERVLMGEPIRNYYPAAISEELFWRVQRKRPEHPSKGNVGTRFANLFPRITHCAHCGSRLKMQTSNSQRNPRNYFTCSNRVLTGGRDCNTTPKNFRYDELEAGILEYVTDFHMLASEAIERRTYDAAIVKRNLKAAQKSVSEYDRRIANLREDYEIEDSAEERAHMRKRIAQLREKREQQIALIGELNAQISMAVEQKQQLATATERVALERLTWTTGTDEEVLQSRSRVAKELAKIISSVQVDFVQQQAAVYVAGYTKIYFFNRDGELVTTMNGTGMSFGEVEKTMRLDGASEAEIALAEQANANIRAR